MARRPDFWSEAMLMSVDWRKCGDERSADNVRQRTGVAKDDISGIWKRVALFVGGKEMNGAADAVWMQAGSWFADIRIAGAGTGEPSTAFGGRTSQVDDEIRFFRDFDLNPGEHDDRARLTRRGNMLIEQGTINISGRLLDYEERWQCDTGTPSHWTIWEAVPPENPSTHLRIIVVDETLALLHGARPGEPGMAAAFYRLRSKEWQILASVGSVELPATLKIPNLPIGAEMTVFEICTWWPDVRWTRCDQSRQGTEARP